ncbi:MAG: hypothetical protein ABI217_05415 [Chthoniobacterales bacterium]
MPKPWPSALLLVFAVWTEPTTAQNQTPESRQITVEAEELPSAYGAPPDLSHGRISTLTKSYVLSPYSFELEAGYEGAIFRHGPPAQLLRQEIEMGLPARFTLGLQNEVEHIAGATHDRSFTLETRYALADWNKLPLNPAISAEYYFGLSPRTSDSAQLTLLVSHDFPHLIESAMNIFVERASGGRSSTSFGFVQSIEVPVLLPEEKLEVGLEMQYRSGGETARGDGTTKGFAIGPTLAWRASTKARFDFSPLFGCSDHTPALQVFAIFSVSLGGPEAGDAEKPASAH